MVIPGREVVVADRPVDSDAVPRVRLKIHLAPAVTLAPPRDGATADLVAADPVKALLLEVGIVQLVNKPMFGCLRADVAGSGSHGLVTEVFARGAAAMGQLPWVQPGRWVVTVADHPPA